MRRDQRTLTCWTIVVAIGCVCACHSPRVAEEGWRSPTCTADSAAEMKAQTHWAPDPTVSPATISGIVESAYSGESLRDIEISAAGSPSRVTTSTHSDAEGHFTLTHVATGTVMVRARAIGRREESIFVDASQGATVLFALHYICTS